MGIEICAVGGYGEVGRNMTAVKVDDDVVIIDMGVHVPNYILLTEDDDAKNISADELRAAKAIPDDKVIKDWKRDVIAIIPTHAHLDHIAAIPFMAQHYEAPIIATPFTIEVIKSILHDNERKLPNKLKSLNINSKMRLSPGIEVEFINVTHSTPQTVMVALHTKYGTVLYANDFKFDLTPTLGKQVNFARLRELNGKVVALIVESLYANEPIKMPSEAVAKEMLKEVLLGTNNAGKAVIITTFSSHSARLKSIVEFGKKMNRKVLFMGRSLTRYTIAAENSGVTNFSKDIELIKYSSKIRKRLGKVAEKDRASYLFVITGHQGEPKATLSKIAFNEIKFQLRPEDHIIFASKVIPGEENIRNRRRLVEKLKSIGVRIFDNIHISGHAGREDLRDLISMVRPKLLFPSHGVERMERGLQSLAGEMGYPKDRVKILHNGQRLRIC